MNVLNHKFWVVINIDSRHWNMEETVKFNTKTKAIRSAKMLASHHHDARYCVLKAECLALVEPSPVKLLNLKELK